MQIPVSERLTYHYVTPDDARFLWEIDQDEAVMKYLNGGTKTSWETVQKQFLPRIADSVLRIKAGAYGTCRF